MTRNEIKAYQDKLADVPCEGGTDDLLREVAIALWEIAKQLKEISASLPGSAGA